MAITYAVLAGAWLVMQIVMADRKSLKDPFKAKEEKQQAASKRG